MDHLPLSSSSGLSRRTLIKSTAATALAATPFISARAQAPARITVAYPSRSGASWAIWLAKQAGLYEKHGLDVKLEYGVHPVGVAMLVSGQAQMALYGIEPILSAAVRDPSMVITSCSLSKGNFALVARKELKTMADLKGKRMGIGRVGDQLYVYVLKMLQKHGLTARDVEWVPTGGDVSSRVKMLQVGQLDASLMVAPGYFSLESQGFNVLDHLANYPDIYVSLVNVFKKSWAKDNPEAIARLTMAQAEAVRLFYDDKATAVRTYRAFDPNQSEADISRLYDLYKQRSILDRIPLLEKAAVASSVDIVSNDLPAIKKFDPASIIDMGPVRKLIGEGYFQKLYGADVAKEEQAKLASSY